MSNRLTLAATLILALSLPAGQGCTSSKTSEETPTGPTSEFRLTVPMLDLSQVRVFLPFGYDFGGGKLNPTYELRTTSSRVPVVASAPGIVEAVERNGPDTGDWEIRVRHEDRPEYLVIYDHVNDVAVSVGQRISAGDPLGRIGSFHLGRGRTELQVNVDVPGVGDKHVCPRSVGSDAFNTAHDAAFARAGQGGGSVCLLEEFTP